MKEEIKFKESADQRNMPVLSLSVSNLEIRVEEGRVYRNSFVIESENRVPVKGFVCSTNDKIDTEIKEFHAVRQEIPYYFKGKLSVAGTEFTGDLVLVTNGGEFNIPYHVQVVSRSAKTSIGNISDMDGFLRLYYENRPEAVSLFFLSEFAEVFLKNEPEKQALYHSFLKSRQRDVIVEEFLIAAGYKEPVRLGTALQSKYKDAGQKIILDAGKEEETILINMSVPGYVEGRILTARNQARISLQDLDDREDGRQDEPKSRRQENSKSDRQENLKSGRKDDSKSRRDDHGKVDFLIPFSSDSFREGCLPVRVRKNPARKTGSDTIRIETIRQTIEIPIEWWDLQPPGAIVNGTKGRRSGEGIRRRKAELMHNYLYFRTGSIGFEDFIESSGKGVEELYELTGEIFCRMYRAHLYIMENKYEAAQNILEEIEDKQSKEELSDLERNYALYLAAMYKKSPEAISKAVVSIRSFFKNSDHKAAALWMLIYLDREYVYNKTLTWDTIRMLFEQGENSCLLYYEACEILNGNPQMMKELGTFEMNVFRWGLRYGYVSLPLSCQFARLAMNFKYYNPAIYHMAVKLYKVEADDLFLSLICSQLIKGNRIGRDYHRFFRLAVEKNLKIIGLNEFFVRTMQDDALEVIPRRVLIYFTYSNSLDYLEKAALYTNILAHKEEYEEVYGAYYSKMLPFVTEQLLKGRINENLARLYTHFQKELLERPENWKAVCDILFYRRLVCRNPYMLGVYVHCPETGEEKYYPFSGGQAVVEVFNERTTLYFTDKREQRYVKDIEYEVKDFLRPDQFDQDWLMNNLANRKVLLVESIRADRRIHREDLPVLQKIILDPDYKPWIRTRSVEKLLTYYENHQNKEELQRWLEKIDYSNISPAYRKTLMDYYMEVGMTENSFFGVELYGCTIMGAEKRMKLAEFGIGYYNGEMDETTLSLAYSAFMRKKNTRRTLTYLMKHFQGETEDLLTIWERSRKFELDTGDFEKRILVQSVFADNDTDGVFPVYQSYYGKNPDDEIISRYLEYVLKKEIEGCMVLPDYMHMTIGQQILSGHIKDRASRISFLYHFADKKDWHEKIHETVRAVIEEFLAQNFYLPVYHKYSDYVTLPIRYEEMNFVTYRGQTQSRVELFYEIEGEENSYRKRRLFEVLPGMYVAGLHLYQQDKVNYRLEENGIRIEDESSLLLEAFDYGGEDSRFFALNHLGSGNAGPMELDDYLMKAWFADTQPMLL